MPPRVHGGNRGKKCGHLPQPKPKYTPPGCYRCKSCNRILPFGRACYCKEIADIVYEVKVTRVPGKRMVVPTFLADALRSANDRRSSLMGGRKGGL